MNVRLTYNIDFMGINVRRGNIIPNKYSVKLNMITATEDSYIQNIAFDRIKFFVKEIFHNSLFTSGEHDQLDSIITLAKGKLVILPEEAVDQIIGMVLFCKLNAILDGNIILEELEISSTDGDNVVYIVDETDNFDIFIDSKNKNGQKKKKVMPWWKREDITSYDTKTNTDEKFNWADIELSWDADENVPDFEFIPEFEDEETDVDDEQQIDEDNIILNNKKKKNPSTNDETGKSKNFVPQIVTGGKNTDETE